ncbi:uncharacterized protein LOC109713237 [Ananas comosus]|uniref:Uncharacterized protein LOC109713237 n=1 Tax=Ananas comosus TaxID=4615 RepID=A0A6P5FA50_ANACO|nr:uncharacterized protein LOC109713237 [Ananas comosus]
MTNEAISNNLIKGLSPINVSKVTLNKFADDTFFFCEARSRYMRHLRFLWRLFEWASGMEINREKSKLYYLGKENGKEIRLAKILECRVGTFPSKYLGLPLFPKPPPKEAWREIILKLHRKIGGWQAKLLSRGENLYWLMRS